MSQADQDTLDQLIASGHRFAICSDFNFPGSGSNLINTKLSNIFNRYGLTQHVTTSTHEYGHTFDQIVTHDDDVNLITSVRVRTAGISDHQLVACRLSLRRDNKTRVTFAYHKIKSIDVNEFCNFVRASRLNDDGVLSIFTADE